MYAQCGEVTALLPSSLPVRHLSPGWGSEHADGVSSRIASHRPGPPASRIRGQCLDGVIQDE